jgi:hypothetical protein
LEKRAGVISVEARPFCVYPAEQSTTLQSKARLRNFLWIVPAVLPLDGLRSLVRLIGVYAVAFGVQLIILAFRVRHQPTPEGGSRGR